MVHPPDDDLKHMQVHMAMMEGGDPHGAFRQHIALHQQQIQAKNMAQQQQMQGQPGSPGGGGQPGAAGAPKPGSQAGPSVQKMPPGAIHQDRMAAAGGIGMPRKT
jgi:hypothetical protein